MSNEAEQSEQRRANLAALAALGVDIHPHRFAATHTVTALVDRYSGDQAARFVNGVLDGAFRRLRDEGRVVD